MKKVLIVDYVHEIMISNFEQAGYICDYFPDYESQDVLKIISNYEGIIINSKTPIYKEQIDLAAKLEFIGRLGSGMEIIDVEYANTKEIKSFSVPEGNKDAVAEHAIGMLLSLFNNLNRADAEVRRYDWQREKNRGIELGGKTLAIIGYGNTGKALAKKLSGFDLEILAYDKYLKDYSDEYAKESSMEEIFKKANIVSFHLPLTPETNYLCDSDYVQKFEKNVFIINTARGKLINLKNILFLLKSGKILGMCLDVFENEKSKTFIDNERSMYDELYASEAVVLSPHVAGWTFESKYKIAKYLSEKIINYYK